NFTPTTRDPPSFPTRRSSDLEVYGQEQKSVLAGKNIRHTMIFPFLRMLANNTQEDVRDLEALHQRLWKIYEKEPEKQVFVQQGRSEEHTSELQSRFDLVCRLL